jgi:hypothetical protein
MVRALALVLISVLACKGEKPREVDVHLGDLVQPRGRQLNYVRGNVYEAKNTMIDVLEGNVIGSKTRHLVINSMRGNVETGSVMVNVLRGNIIDGQDVSVQVLIGRDFSGKARVQKQVDQ